MIGTERAAPTPQEASEAAALKVAGLVAGYGTRTVLHGIDLVVSAGGVTAVVGPNGAGKSTLVRALCGRITPSAGAVTVGGIPAGHAAARQRIGLAPQEMALYRSLTIAENLSVFARLGGVPRAGVGARVDTILAQTGTAARRDARIEHLSGGWQRRANIAAALVADPRLLVLDEPTVGVDAPARSDLAALIRALAADGKAVLVVTHDFAFAEAAADRVAILVDGRLALEGPLAALLEARFARRRAIDFVFARAPDAALSTRLAALGLAIRPPGDTCRGFIAPGARPVAALLEALEQAGAAPQTVALRAAGLAELYADVVGEASA